jgi:hypothetical protein
MGDKNLAYDHPSYTTQRMFPFNGAAGAAAAQLRMPAPCDGKIIGVASRVVTAGTTAGHAVVGIVVSGTTTTTTTLTALSTATAGVNGTNTFGTGSRTVSRGDLILIQNGTDATGVACGALIFEPNGGAALIR